MPIPFNSEVVRVRPTPTGDERKTFRAHVTEASRMSLPKNSDVTEDDFVEWTTPVGHVKLLRITKVKFNNAPRGGGQLDHTEIHLVPARSSRPATPVQSLTISGLHPAVSSAAAALFADGHYSQAVFEAMKALEARVQSLSPADRAGKSLMSRTFGGSMPSLDVTTTTGQSAADEREGFAQLFMGAVQGVRNPRGHGQPPTDGPDETLEYLALASMLMRRLDIAETRLG